MLPAGPTVVDMLANAAFYYGLVRVLAEDDRPIWTQMSFSAAEENFHAGARDGIDARVYWPGRRRGPGDRAGAAPAAADGPRGARRAGASTPPTATGCSAIIERRCVDAAQRRVVAGRPRSTGSDDRGSTASDALREMTVRYREHMHSNEPVHTWPLP